MPTTQKRTKRRSVKPPPAPRESMLTFERHEWRSIRDDIVVAVKWCEKEGRRDSAVFLGKLMQGISSEIRDCHRPVEGDGYADRITIRRPVDDWTRTCGLMASCPWKGVLWSRFAAQVSAAAMEDD